MASNNIYFIAGKFSRPFNNKDEIQSWLDHDFKMQFTMDQDAMTHLIVADQSWTQKTSKPKVIKFARENNRVIIKEAWLRQMREEDAWVELSDEHYHSKGDNNGVKEGENNGVKEGGDNGVKEGENNGVKEGENNGGNKGGDNGVKEGENNGGNKGGDNGVKEGENNGVKEGENNGGNKGGDNGVKEGENNGVKEGENNGVKEGGDNGVKEGENNGVKEGENNGGNKGGDNGGNKGGDNGVKEGENNGGNKGGDNGVKEGDNKTAAADRTRAHYDKMVSSFHNAKKVRATIDKTLKGSHNIFALPKMISDSTTELEELRKTMKEELCKIDEVVKEVQAVADSSPKSKKEVMEVEYHQASGLQMLKDIDQLETIDLTGPATTSRSGGFASVMEANNSMHPMLKKILEEDPTRAITIPKEKRPENEAAQGWIIAMVDHDLICGEPWGIDESPPIRTFGLLASRYPAERDQFLRAGGKVVPTWSPFGLDINDIELVSVTPIIINDRVSRKPWLMRQISTGQLFKLTTTSAEVLFRKDGADNLCHMVLTATGMSGIIPKRVASRAQSKAVQQLAGQWAPDSLLGNM
ncbi:hypothetical protein B0T10DRAFT_561510 [Thelonectria olida]|uniref:BRCT domain-containing protein n=1 Tax=Thelonectria olida TaxID=1576542 RepID=A0A9P8W8B2_9HYPO|nr:hypothetical protein B0T10DRAFT_561510 [Thelonectria olida]